MARRIQAVVYNRDGVTPAAGTVGASTLTADRDRKWLEDLNGVGSWSLEVPVGHPDEALLTDGRIIRLRLDGTSRFAGRVEPRKKVAADPSRRRSGRIVNVGGRGLLSLLENAVLYPELGIGLIAPDVRFFNFSSRYYDDSWWPSVSLLAQQGDTAGTNPKAGFPEDWPDPLAWWIWDSTGFTPPTAVGDVYMRGIPSTVSYDTDARVFVTADDGFEVYGDASRIAAETAAGIWAKTRYFDLRLSAAHNHQWAIKGTNIARPNPLTNGAAVIFGVYELLSGGSAIGPAIFRSDYYWKILAYPSTPPGMTPGQILDILLTEAQARGTLTELSWDFDETYDSDGVPWPTEIDVSFPVGTNYLDVVRHLVDEHALDVSFSQATMTLHAHVDRGGVNASAIVLGPAAGANVAALTFEKRPPGPNVVLGRTATGQWVETVDAGAAGTYGRREIALSLGGAPTDEAAARQTAAFLEDNSQPVESITDLRLEVVPGGPQPYVDFNVGDRVTAPTYALGSGPGNRLYSIAVSEDGAGNPIFTPELVK